MFVLGAVVVCKMTWVRGLRDGVACDLRICSASSDVNERGFQFLPRQRGRVRKKGSARERVDGACTAFGCGGSYAHHPRTSQVMG